jgi:hypothetical protein
LATRGWQREAAAGGRATEKLRSSSSSNR